HKDVKSSTSRTRRETYTARGGVHVHPCTPLADWLDALRSRGLTASVDAGVATLHGPVTQLDLDWLDRHHDAFLHAATHPAWWAAIVGRTVDQLNARDAPDRCLAAGCPGELQHYTHDALPFCVDHDPALWTARTPDIEAAA